MVVFATQPVEGWEKSKARLRYPFLPPPPLLGGGGAEGDKQSKDYVIPWKTNQRLLILKGVLPRDSVLVAKETTKGCFSSQANKSFEMKVKKSLFNPPFWGEGYIKRVTL